MEHYPQKEKRKTDLTLAYPIKGKGVTEFVGRLYAYLPTREQSLLPVHVNADFYPNTDRKGLLWDEKDKSNWNEQLLCLAAKAIPELLRDLQVAAGTEAVYDFAAAVSKAAEQIPQGHNLEAFVETAWEACQKAFREFDLFESRGGEYVSHCDFLIIPYAYHDLLADLLASQLQWALPPERHSTYQSLFEKLRVDKLDAAKFSSALKRLLVMLQEFLPNLAYPLGGSGKLEGNAPRIPSKSSLPVRRVRQTGGILWESNVKPGRLKSRKKSF